jgi:hypothetical protein
MLFLLGLVIRVLSRLLVSPRNDDGSKDLEILVLRHQLRVLRRKTGPPKLRFIDQVLLAAASPSIPRDRWSCFIDRDRRVSEQRARVVEGDAEVAPPPSHRASYE